MLELFKLEKKIMELCNTEDKTVTVHFEKKTSSEYEDEEPLHSVSAFLLMEDIDTFLLLKQVQYKNSYEECMKEIIEHITKNKIS